MKISPVKNYKKPNYAARIAAISTALVTLSGCDTTIVSTDGVVAPPPDLTIEETALAGDVAVISEDTTTSAEMTTAVPAGTVTTVSENHPQTEDETGNYTEESTIAPPEELVTSGTVAAAGEEDETAVAIAGDVAVVYEEEFELAGEIPLATDEVGDCDIAEVPSEGIVVAPEDVPAEDEFQLAGDIAVVEDDPTIDGGIVIEPDEDEAAIAEEFSLAGDIAVPPDYNSENIGMEYADLYISSFYECGIPLQEKAGDEWGPFAFSYGDIPFIVSLEGTQHRLYISFYNSEDGDVCTEIENAGAEKFEYGYISAAYINNEFYRLLFIDISKPHFESIYEIADNVISKGVPLSDSSSYSEEVFESPLIAYETGIEYADEYVKAFENAGCTLTAYTDGSAEFEYKGNNIPMAFDSTTHKLFIAFYDSQNSADPIRNILENSGAARAVYGYLTEDGDYKIFFIDISGRDFKNAEEIANAVMLEETNLL